MTQKQTKAQKAQEIRETLPHFYGTTEWHGYGFPFLGQFYLTDGAKYLADTAGAWWLIDIIISVWRMRTGKGIHSYRLKVHEGDSATFTMTDGNDTVLYRQEIPWTDFPLDEMELWASGDRVILLPSEY